MPKLSETLAAKLPFAEEGTDKYWDSELKGLVLFVGKRSKTWYFQKDIGTQTKRIMIGRFPVITSQAARQTAMTYALEWSKGAGRRAQRRSPTLEQAMESYLARPKLRSQANIEGMRRQFDRHLKDWMKLPLDEIDKMKVATRHREMGHIPSGANHVLKSFRTVWNHARRTAELPECPTMAIEWYQEEPEGSVIDDLREWKATIDALENPIHRAFYQFILFTGLRKNEAFKLDWRNVHADHIHIPMTKNGRAFDLPIVDHHHEILKPMKGLSRSWVFPSPKSPKGHITNPQRLRWSPHAHRRTFATVAVEAGILEEIVGRLLNHTPVTVTGARYVRPKYDALIPSMQAIVAELIERLHRG